MPLADIFLAVPRVILALALSQVLGPSLPNMLLALTITYWPWFARTVGGGDALGETSHLRRGL